MVSSCIVKVDTMKITSKFPERFKQDEIGQWWNLQSVKAGWWVKVNPRVCPVCGVEYVAPYRSASQATECCSRGCGVRKSHHDNPRSSGEKNGRWKGGTKIVRGYVWEYCPDHPTKKGKGPTNKYVLQHRLVMEKMLGRYLEPHEQVHHKNAIRNDNRPENLELWVISQPPGAREHEQQHCPTCTCFLHKKD